MGSSNSEMQINLEFHIIPIFFMSSRYVTPCIHKFPSVTANLMFTDLILRVFNEGICIMSGAFQPAVMGRIFPRYSFTFSSTRAGGEVGRFYLGLRMEAKIISALMYDLIPRWHTQPVCSLVSDFNMGQCRAFLVGIWLYWVSIRQWWQVLRQMKIL